MNKLGLSPECKAKFSVKVEKLDKEMREIKIESKGLFDMVTNSHGEKLVRIKAPHSGQNLRAIFSFEKYHGVDIALLVCGFFEKNKKIYTEQALVAKNRLEEFRRLFN